MAYPENRDWNFGESQTSSRWEACTLAVLLDIRGEMRRIRAVLECRNTQDVPFILRRIESNTRKPRRGIKRKKKGA